VPVLITHTSTPAFDFAAQNGWDIAFFAEDATPYHYDIDTWSATELALWVQVPIIRAGESKQHFWFCWGKSGAPFDLSDSATVWSAFAFVHHFSSIAAGTAPAGRSQTPTGIGLIPGPVASAGEFTGAGSVLDIEPGLDDVLGADVTTSFWVDCASGGCSDVLIDTPDLQWGGLSSAGGTLDLSADVQGASLSTGPLSGTRHHFSMTRTAASGDVALYVDGELSSSAVGSTGALDVSGSDPGRINGEIDELRVAGQVRTATWIRASYRSQAQTLLTECGDADGDESDRCDEDCDDTSAEAWPGGVEICDGLDNDCNGSTDGADAIGQTTFYPDLDGDGFGDPSSPTDACQAPPNYTTDNTDCVDTDPNQYPGAVWYQDFDGDGWGDLQQSQVRCTQPAGWAAEPGDCDETDAAFYPGAPEEDCSDPNDYNCDGGGGFDDLDADGSPACEDCDDSDAQRSPGATEVCDSIDNDCDERVDDDDDDLDISTGTTSYYDADGDGFGHPDHMRTSCNVPEWHVLQSGDCNDVDPSIHPGAEEHCNNRDDDCNGSADDNATEGLLLFYTDADGDGFGTDAFFPEEACPTAGPEGMVDRPGDCHDGDDTVFPLAPEQIGDGVDQDCDGSDLDEAPDSDRDGISDEHETDRLGTDPESKDSDFDGLHDGDELWVHGTRPTDSDTDDGGAMDGREVKKGTDPLDPTDDAQAVGGCNATGGSSGWWLVFAVALATRRRTV